jgi:coiled-coil-helix-coiled-coil-helix domain-containing protein 10
MRSPVASRPAPTPAPRPQPPQQSSVPAMPPQQQSGGMLAGIGSTIAQGMAFGTGSAIAHRAVGAVANSFGGGSESAPQQAAPAAYDQSQLSSQQLTGACAQDKAMFYECLQVNRGDQQACQFLYEQLKQCQMSEPQFG